MASETWWEAGRLASSLGVIAAGVVPLTVAAWLASRRRGQTLPWRIRPWPTPWRGGDVLLLFAWGILLPPFVSEALAGVGFFDWLYGPWVAWPRPSEAALAAVAGSAAGQQAYQPIAQRQVAQGLWGSLLAAPLLAGVVIAWRWLVFARGRPADRRGVRPWLPRVALAGLAWSLITPAVFAVHFASLALSAALGATVDDHPLTRLGQGASALDRALFVVQACGVSPIVEEWLCRGLLLPWAVRRVERVWATLAAAILLSLTLGLGSPHPLNRFGTAMFLTLIALGFSLRHWRGAGRRQAVRWRRWGGLAASAGVFAALHAAVWPSPLPLFVLGMGLGWLALVTRGIFAPALVHGLFNAVSVRLVLGGE